MKKIKWILETGYAGIEHEGEFEVDDDVTDKEIDEMVREDAFNCISWGWSVVEEGGDEEI